MVHEVMSPKKLDFKGIYSGEVCPNDRYIIETIFKWKNPDGFVINSSIVLFIDFGWIFHNIKRPNYELTLINQLPSEIGSTMDLATTIQYKFITVNVNNRNVHKKMLQILQSIQTIYLCFLIQSTNQQDCQVYSWQMLLINDGPYPILPWVKINKLRIVVKNDTLVQKRIVILLHI